MRPGQPTGFYRRVRWAAAVVGTALAASGLGQPLAAEAPVTAATDAPRLIEMPLPYGPAAAQSSRAVVLEAEQLAYSADTHTLVATGKATLTHQGLEIQAAGIQYDILSGAVRAQGEVAVSQGESRLTADALSYDARGRRGLLLRSGPPEEYLNFSADGLKTSALPSEAASAPSWRASVAPLETGDTRTWVIAREASVLPGERLMLTRAAVEVDGVRMMSLPHLVSTPSEAGPGLLNQMMGYSSGAGLRMEFPYYYAAGEKRLGSLRVTHNGGYGSGGYFSPGWALNLQEEYLRGRSRGTISLDDLVGSTRGLRWQHRQELGRQTGADLSFGLLKSTDDSPRVTSLGANVGHKLGRNSLTLNLGATSFSGSKLESATIGLALPDRPIGRSGVTYAVSTGVRLSRSTFETAVPVFDGKDYYYLPSSSQTSSLLQSVGLRLLFPQWKLGPKTTVIASLGGDYLWGDSANGRATANARLSLRRNLGRASSLLVQYSFADLATQPGPYYYSLGRQYLVANLELAKGNRWSLQGTGSWDLEAGSSYGMVDVSRGLGRGRLGEPRYRVGTSSFVSQIPDYETSYTRLYLARAFPNYVVTLNYSPHSSGSLPSHGYFTGAGYEYTFAPGRKFWVELSLRRF